MCLNCAFLVIGKSTCSCFDSICNFFVLFVIFLMVVFVIVGERVGGVRVNVRLCLLLH